MKRIAVFLALVVSLGLIWLTDNKKSPLIGWTSACCYAKTVNGNSADAANPATNPYLAKAIAGFAPYDRFGEHPGRHCKGEAAKFVDVLPLDPIE